MWEAVYKDGSSLKQFKEDGTEVLFKEIEQEKLGAFVWRSTSPEIAVNVTAGIFFINGVPLSIPKISYRDDLNYRLIHFRRIQKHLGSSGGISLPDNVEAFIGFQVTIDGTNHKYMLSESKNVIQAHFE